jgi:SAM-dependent methyltransferase
MNADHGREIADNRRLWDAWTAIHTTGSFYDVQRFRDDPADVRIEPWERDEVGDVTGKTLLHLQCHFGLDTISWARLGAAHVTGVDFSEAAIASARELAAGTGLADRARFVASNIYDLPGPLEGETFDVVYTGRGALGWLPDLEPWAEMVASFLTPGGIFFIHEGHPILWALDDEQPVGSLRLAYDYWGGETLTFPVEGSYADPTAAVDAEVEHGWNHSLGEVVTLLARNGLRIEFLDEKRELGWPAAFLQDRGDGSFVWPDDLPGSLPLMYSLRARKDTAAPSVSER